MEANERRRMEGKEEFRQYEKRKDNKNKKENGKKICIVPSRTRHVCFSQIAPCIHSSHNDLFLFWNQFFRICQECISTDSI